MRVQDTFAGVRQADLAPRQKFNATDRMSVAGAKRDSASLVSRPEQNPRKTPSISAPNGVNPSQEVSRRLALVHFCLGVSWIVHDRGEGRKKGQLRA